ncbi:MAG: electron transport complex subunit RsxC [Gammaproteobacteria bacterium]
MLRLRRLRFRGGVHPEGHKQSTTDREIEPLPLPARLYLPVQQHIGAPAEPLVKPGDYVLKGQLLARSAGAVSAPVHASTSGTVVAIEPFTAPHPSGLPVRTVILEPDGEERWAERSYDSDAFAMTPEEIAARVGAAGIVGMGGAAFPAAVKLNLGSRNTVHTLVINGGECEPYLTCDDRLMQERPREIIDGVRIMMRALHAHTARIAIEDNKPYAIAAMTAAAAACPDVHVTAVPTRYPMGSEKQMIQALTGLEVPAGKLSADVGIVVHNVATAHAVRNALRRDQALISRIVTVGGGAVDTPRNLEVPLGTLVSDLLEACGLKEEPARLLAGGPMMGMVLPHAQVPVVKGTNGIIALTAKEINAGEVRPCIRCARCVAACPCGLMPLEMASRVRSGDIDGAVSYGLGDCISCGSCSYVCPSNIPLVQYFNFAKGALANQREEQRKTEETRRLAAERNARLEAAKQQKANQQRRRSEAAESTESG